MKHLLYSLCAMLLVLACQQADKQLVPTDPLYQRWRLQGTTSNFLTFRADGVLLYGADGKDDFCCALRFFTRRDSLIDFRNPTAKSLPGGLKKVDCSLFHCVSINDTEPWWIVSLTPAQLMLTQYKSTRIYEAD